MSRGAMPITPRNVRLMCAASENPAWVIRQYLQRTLVDEMHLAVTPVLLGSGEHFLSGLDLPALGYVLTEQVMGENAAHMVVTKPKRG